MSRGRDKHHGEIIKSLKEWGLSPYSTPARSFAPSGEPDIRVTWDTVIEVKTGWHGSINLSAPQKGNGWKPDQREWARQWVDEQGGNYFLVVFFKTKLSANRVNRACYAVPYRAILDTVKMIPQKSLPFRVLPGMNKQMQRQGLDAERMWADFELPYAGGGLWDLPPEHPLLYALGDQP